MKVAARHNLDVPRRLIEPDRINTNDDAASASGNRPPLIRRADLENESWPFRFQLLLRPGHVETVGLMLGVAVAGIAVYWTIHAVAQGGLTDIDQMKYQRPIYEVDLNSAGVAELENLPGLGPGLARQIVLFREQHGSFRSLSDLRRVRGIGEARLATLRPYLVLSQPPTR